VEFRSEAVAAAVAEKLELITFGRSSGLCGYG
jgi:hypothetical protein